MPPLIKEIYKLTDQFNPPKPRWKSTISFELEEAKFLVMPDGECFTIKAHDWNYECLFIPSSTDKLVVMLSGAVDRSKISLPAFARTKHTPIINANILCISDPTLNIDSEIHLGWYMGTHNNDASIGLSKIINKAFHDISPHQRPVIFGSSAGGFAALQAACRIGKASAVAFNPQIRVSSYYARHTNAFQKAFGADLNDNEYEFRNDVAKLINKSNLMRAIIVQNKMDTHHLNIHLHHLKEVLGINDTNNKSDDGRITIRYFESEKGHEYENIEETKFIFNKLWDFIGN